MCRAPIEAEWRACPSCGADLGVPHSRMASASTASALPGVDTGEVAFVPVLGGAKRPITFVELGPAPGAAPSVSLTSLTVHGNSGNGVPLEPLSETPRRPVTVIREPEEEAPLELPERARASVEDVRAPETTLAPTVLFVAAQEPQAERQLGRADLSEIERVIGEAVDRAMRQFMAHNAPTQTALLSSSTVAPPVARKRVAGAGAGLLVGGALGGVLVLNWDIWVRGEVANVVGWLQQTGLMGTAALVGAGAAALILVAPRGKKRGARAR